jgi:hypothetical protein
MSNPVIESSFLSVDVQASEWHNKGLNESNRHEFPAAYLSLDQAIVSIDEAPPTVDRDVHFARVIRDIGATNMRQALVDGDPDLELIDVAKQHLRLSQFTLKDSETPNKSFVTQDHEKEKFEEISSERSATVGMLGRLATAQMVLTGEPVQTDAYQEAHQLSLEGSNGYYRVSNAVNAARHERLSSRPKETIKWLGRAAFGLAWTAANDRRNLKRAVLTAGDRVLGLRSKKAAKASVFERP